MTKYIDPSGNGDYLSVPAAIAANPADRDWACRAGDCGSGQIPANVTIRPDTGAGVDKLVDAGATGFAYFGGDITVNGGDVKIEGMRVHGRMIVSLSNKHNVEVLGNQILMNGSTPQSYLTAMGNVTGVKFNGNVIFFDQWTHVNPANALLVQGGLGPFAGSLACEVRENTIVNRGTDSLDDGILARTATQASVLNADVRDNVVIGASNCFRQTGSGTFNVTSSNNASGDATADDLGGAGHLLNQMAADWFVDPANDVNLKSGSPGIGAGSASNNIGAAQ